MPKKMHTTQTAVAPASAHNWKSTPLLDQLLNRQSAIGNPQSEPWVGTSEAARLSGYSKRHIRRLCDEGFFIEGVDWKQRPARPGLDRGGYIEIRRAALKKLEGS